MTVLDANTVLALVQDEPGVDLVERTPAGAWLSPVSLVEVVGMVVDADHDPRRLRALLRAGGVVLAPLTEADDELAGVLIGAAGGCAPSVSDRCCPALATCYADGSLQTADRAWAALNLPLTVELVR